MKHLYISRKLTAILLCCLVSLFAVIPAWSQTESTNSFLDKVSIGGRLGANFASMSYSDPNLAEYQSSLFSRGAIGLYAEIDITKNISLRPEMMIIGKGQIIDNDDIYYRFGSGYFDLRLPIILNFGEKSSIRPYLFVAPTLGIATGGTIEVENELGYWDTDITDASIAPFDLGAMAGAGVKIPIKLNKFTLLASVEVAYNMGLTDTYSEYEKTADAEALNRKFYTIDGSRKNRGFEVTASLAVPLSNFKAKKKEPTKSLFAQEKETTIKKVEPKEILKSCYTIEEINDLINQGKNVNNRVICMNNLNFESNKSTLDKTSRTYLDNVVTLLNKVSSMKMKISGHTDNVGKDDFNMDLSKKRASAVCDYMISKGVSKDRLSYEYYGSTKPLALNDSDENRAKNRRVEFAIIQK